MFKFPYTNLYELNLDWILEKVKTLVANNDEFNDKADYAVETADEAKTIAEQASQAQIGDGAVTTIKLADGAVTSAKLANNAVYSSNIVDGEVGTSDLAEGAVTTSRILDGAVTGAKIFDGAVTSAKLGNGAVTNAKLADSAVTTIKVSAELKPPTYGSDQSGSQYIKFANGVLIQWGSAGAYATSPQTVTVTFPQAFSSDFYAMSVTTKTVSEFASYRDIIYVVKPSASGMDVYCSTTNNTNPVREFRWIALGLAAS